MKLLLLHLSDMHINSNVNLTKIDKIVESMNIFSPDEIIVILSGDLSYSGSINQFKSVREFMGTLLFNLGKKFGKRIMCYMVPGNHDMFYSNGKLPSGNTIKKLVEKDAEKNYKKELSKLKNFFEYASSKGSFRNNKDVDSIIIDYPKNGIKVQINLINTAIFSTSKNDNKESHFLPDEAMSRLLREEDVNLAISVMHHSSEWFHYNTKQKLETLLYKHSDIIFQGHEHQVGSRHTYNEDDSEWIVSKGGEFSGKYTDMSTYAALMIDFEEQSYCEYIYKWDLNENMFLYTQNGKRSLSNTKNFFLNKSSFYDSYFADNNGISNSVLNYFIFPNLQNEKSKAEKTIENIDEFCELLGHFDLINIKGQSRSGKTTLLKGLYYYFLKKGFVPLIFNKDNLQTKLNTLVQNLFKEQYSDNEAEYQKFLYLDKHKRIILIDDFEEVEPEGMRKRLLPTLLKVFGTIIFTSSNGVDLDIREYVFNEMKSEVSKEENICVLCINNFYKEKREELIKSVLKCKNNTNEENNSLISQSIDYIVRNKKYGLFNLSPEFIIQYVNFFLAPGSIERKTQTFNVVFETNINSQIIKSSKKHQVDDTISFLEEIAYYMHFVLKNSIISLEEIEHVYQNTREDRGLDLNVISFINSMIKANVLKETRENNKYEFVNINYLAYFVAKKINKIISRKSSYDIDEINYLLKYIAYGINDNVLVFLLYIRNNVQFSLNICKGLRDFYKEYEELDFDKNNVPFLKNISESDQKIISKGEKESVNRIQSEAEKRASVVQEEEIRFKSLYEYPSEIDSTIERIPQSIKWLEIVSKSFVSLYNDFSQDEREELFDTLLVIQNKILYCILNPLNQNFENEVEDFLSMIKETDLKEGFEANNEKEEQRLRKIVRKLFVVIANGFCLDIYNNFSSITSTPKIIKFMDKNSSMLRNENDELYYLMSISSSGNTDYFIKKAIDLFDKNKNGHMRFLIKLIVNHHIINNNLDHKQINLLDSKIFSKEKSLFKNKSKTNLLLSNFFSDES